VRVIPDRVFQEPVREYPEEARPRCPESQTGGDPMRRDELMKPDSLSEILVVVGGAVLLVVLIMVGIAALMGN